LDDDDDDAGVVAAAFFRRPPDLVEALDLSSALHLPQNLS
jgi:hypothetical protein